MDLSLKRPWLGLLGLCVAMVLSKSENPCQVVVQMDPLTLLRIVQVAVINGNILQNMIEKAMKTGDNCRMIKGIKGLKLEDMDIPCTLITLEPNQTVRIELTTNITVAGKSFIGGYMTIAAGSVSNVTGTITKGSNSQLHLKVTQCNVALKSCKTNLPSSMLPKIVNKFLDSTLGKIMPGVLCPAADMLMIKQMEAFEFMLAKKPIGKLGYILYEVTEQPVVSRSFISIYLKITVQKINGEEIQYNCDSGPNELPPKQVNMSAVYLPGGALNAVLILLQPQFNTQIAKVKGSVPTSDQIKKILPKAGLPAGKKLKIQITHRKSPTVTISSTASYLTIHTEASFLDVKGGKELLSIQTMHQIAISLTIEKEMLGISLTAGSSSTKEISSSVGDVTGAKVYMETVTEEWIRYARGVMNNNQIPLPNFMNITSTTKDAKMQYDENLLVLHWDIQPYEAKEMSAQVKKQCEKIKFK